MNETTRETIQFSFILTGFIVVETNEAELLGPLRTKTVIYFAFMKILMYTTGVRGIKIKTEIS